MSNIEQATSVLQSTALSEALSYIDGIEVSIAEGEFTPSEALIEMFDVYWSTSALGLSETEKQALQTLIFEKARDSRIDFEEVLETWQQIAEKESNK